jgi:C1A family cysteine protease
MEMDAMPPMGWRLQIGGGVVRRATGWLSPYPDLRDYTEVETDVARLSSKLGIVPKAEVRTLPSSIDLRSWCSPVENQGAIGSCTAHAAVGMVEYLQRRAHGKHIDASPLFVYKATRSLMGVRGDTGAWLRHTMAALRLCGAPPEKYWPYTENTDGADGRRTFDDDPPAFVFALAEDYEASVYFCHDPAGCATPFASVVASVKRYLAAGVPAIFGFYGFSSAEASDVPGAYPLPARNERAAWAHAVAAVGYDDAMVITNTRTNEKSEGAFRIRNSWGAEWGDAGYGWIPYDYVLRGWALDFWSLLCMDWVDTGAFGLS